MKLSAVERVIMERFREKTRIAGGPRAGYMLRKQAIAGARAFAAGDGQGEELESALSALLERGLLKVNEGGQLYYLTADAVALLEGAGAPA